MNQRRMYQNQSIAARGTVTAAAQKSQTNYAIRPAATMKTAPILT